MTLRDENAMLRGKNNALREAATAMAYNMRMLRRHLGMMPIDVKRLESFADAAIAWCDRVGCPNPMPSSVYQVLLDCESALTKLQGVRCIDDTSPAPYDVIYTADNAELLERLGKIARPKPKDAK